MHVVLRDKFSGFGVELNGGPICKWGRGNHHTRSVYACLTSAAFNTLCEVYDFSRLIVFVVELLEFWFEFKCVCNSHGESLTTHRNKFSETVSCTIRVPKRACYVAHCSTRHHGAKSSNLRHVILPVLLLCICNHFVASVISKVHVDIRSLWSLRVQESLKGKFVGDRIHGGDAV